MPTIIENQITLTRSDPPGLAKGDPERRMYYAAAIQLYEELMGAARSVGPFARPLPLFYALSQGGRAIVSACGTEPWLVRGHGLRECELTEPITDSTIEPVRGGLFSRVCEILETGPLTGPIQLGAAWLALPELAFTVPPNAEWPRALRAHPEDAAGVFARFKGGGNIVIPQPHNAEELLPTLSEIYPAAERARLPKVDGRYLMAQTPHGLGYVARWGEEVWAPGAEPQWAEIPFAEAIRPHRFQAEHWLVPRVGSGRDILSPLALWWVLLFTLSLIARYEPAKWKRALDVDESQLAVYVHDVLEQALTAIPHLLLIALSGDAWVLPVDTPGL